MKAADSTPSLRIQLRALRLWWKLNPRYVITCIVSPFLTAVLPYITLYFTARLLDAIAAGAPADTLWRLLAGLLAASLFCGGANALLKHWKTGLDETRGFGQTRCLADKMLSMDYEVADDPKTSQLYDAILTSSNSAGWGFLRTIELLPSLSGAVTRILGAVVLSVNLFRLPAADAAFAWLNSPLYTVLLLAALVLSALGSGWLRTRSYAIWASNVQQVTFSNRLFSFFFRLLKDGTEQALDARTYRQDQLIDAINRAPENNVFRLDGSYFKAYRGPMGGLNALGRSLTWLFTGLVYLYVCLKAMGKAFGVGAVTQYVGAITSMAQGVADLLEGLGEMKNNQPFLEQFFQFLDLPNKMYQGSLTTEKRSDRQYEIEFRDVSFQYPGSDQWALHHVNMKFKVGSRLAVVGQNGSGKTTFIKLMCRLYDPTEGQILLNGIDIRKYNYKDYLALFSVVFQDFQLLAFPLGQNVAGARQYDPDRAADCLNKAAFGDRLNTLPHGLDTALYKEFDPEGVEISGGEAQKIAIARTLYKDAPFLILDEPTAALDPIAETQVYAKFNEIAADKTAIYISHRLSSCRFCDEIAVFDHGQVIQQGTHDALLADEGGKYYALWMAQAQYYTTPAEA